MHTIVPNTLVLDLLLASCSDSAQSRLPPSLKHSSSFPPADRADNTFKLWKGKKDPRGKDAMPEPSHSLLSQGFRCVQRAAEKNQPKVCSFSWRGSVCRIRAYLDMAEMGFLNKGLGEVSPRAAATAPTTQRVSRFTAYLPARVKLSRPTAQCSKLPF